MKRERESEGEAWEEGEEESEGEAGEVLHGCRVEMGWRRE